MRKKILSFLKLGNIFLMLSIFSSNIAAKFNEVAINDAFVKEFELKQLIFKINRTNTRMGFERLVNMVAKPVYDQTLLEKRQKFIPTLAHYNHILNELRGAVKIVAKHEQSMRRYTDREDRLIPYVNNNFLPSLFGIKKLSNLPPIALQGYYSWKVFFAISNFMIAFGIKGIEVEVLNALRHASRWNFSGLNPSGIWGFFKSIGALSWKDIIDRHKWTQTKHFFDGKDKDGKPAIFKINLSTWLLSQQEEILKEEILNNADTVSFQDVFKETPRNIYTYLTQVDGWYRIFAFPAAISGTAFEDLRKGEHMYKAWPGIQNTIIPMQDLQKHLVSFASLMKAIKKIIKIQVDHKLFSDLLPNIKGVLKDEKIREIFTLLETETFTEEYTFLFNHGRVLYTHKLITENLDKILKLFLYVGELDCYLSLATLYNEMKDEERTYTFAEYVPAKQGAIIDCDDAWVPLFSEKSAIQNIKLGISGQAQNMIITGPNMSGKSIYLKMTGIIVLLAQTITIVPAKSCKITLFHSIYSCLDPVGDVTRGLSKFGSQKLHLEKISKEIDISKQKEKPGLFLIDEALNGTYEDLAGKRIKIFGNQVANNPFSITLITTHLEQPISLEKDTKGLFKNFHIEILPRDNGGFERTFKIKAGFAPWWFSDEHLRDAYVDWIELPKKNEDKDFSTQ